MNMKFYEKLLILVVLFLGVTIGTAAIIGVYVGTTNKSNEEKQNSIILESIPVFHYDYNN